jgi:hypothetical protein
MSIKTGVEKFLAAHDLSERLGTELVEGHIDALKTSYPSLPRQTLAMGVTRHERNMAPIAKRLIDEGKIEH